MCAFHEFHYRFLIRAPGSRCYCHSYFEDEKIEVGRS